VLVVRGGEHDARQPVELGQQVEAAAPRHLDVEEHEVGRELLDARPRLVDVAGLADDLDGGKYLEQAPQLAARERFIVDDQRLHAGSRRVAVAAAGRDRSSSSEARSPYSRRRRSVALRSPTPSPPAVGLSTGHGLSTRSTSPRPPASPCSRCAEKLSVP